jgi:L-lactate dehydrogenase complex protein LldG
MMDTSQARAAILARIRSNQKRGPQASATETAAVADYLARHPAGPRPSTPPDIKARFRTMAERSECSYDEVGSRADAPAAVARYLQANGLEHRAVIWPEFAPLDWAAAGIAVEARPVRRDEAIGVDRVGVTGCFCALAETGTLVLLSGPLTASSTHLLPETYIALVPASRIVRDMEDAFELMRKETAQLPRAVNMVSGPSRTADIEQTIVLGAHGPIREHVIVMTAE